jgi:hypothetical protein
MASRTLGSQNNAIWQMVDTASGKGKGLSDAKLERENIFFELEKGRHVLLS